MNAPRGLVWHCVAPFLGAFGLGLFFGAAILGTAFVFHVAGLLVCSP